MKRGSKEDQSVRVEADLKLGISRAAVCIKPSRIVHLRPIRILMPVGGLPTRREKM